MFFKSCAETWKWPPLLLWKIWKIILQFCISCLLKVSLVKCLRTFMNKGLFQFPQLKVSRCDFNGSSANEPDHSKLSDNVSKAYNNPNTSNLAEATRRKEGRVQTLGRPNQLHRCTRNVISQRPNQCLWQEAARLTEGFILCPFTLWQAQHGLLLSPRFCFWHHIHKIM